MASATPWRVLESLITGNINLEIKPGERCWSAGSRLCRTGIRSSESFSPPVTPSQWSQNFAQFPQDNSDLWRPDWYLGMRAEVSISVCVSGRRDSVGVLWETSDWGRWRHLAVISVSVSHWQSGGTGLARLLCWATHYTLPNTTISLSLSLSLSHTHTQN